MMNRYIAISQYTGSDTGIFTIFNVSIHRISQYIAIIGCIDLNNMICKLKIL